MARVRGLRSAPRFSTGQRRRTSWVGGPAGSLTFSASNATGAFTVGSQALVDGLTLVRLRGELLVFLTASNASDGGWDEVAVGVCIVSENAFNVGITAIPTPATDIAWDGWLWYWTGSLKTPRVDAGPDNISIEGSMARIVVDSKAMRKIKATDVIVGVAEVGTEDGVATMELKMESRALVKLS